MTRIDEPELEQFVFLNGQWERQEMNLYNYVTTQWSYIESFRFEDEDEYEYEI